MNTIANYVSTLFTNLPDTEKNRQAQLQLTQQMSARYQQLLDDGQTDKEALGQLMTEFTNLASLDVDYAADNAQQPHQRPRRTTAERIFQQIYWPVVIIGWLLWVYFLNGNNWQVVWIVFAVAGLFYGLVNTIFREKRQH